MSAQRKILQCNLNRSLQATENTLQLAIELGVSIIAVQEPWIRQSRPILDYTNIPSINPLASTQQQAEHTNHQQDTYEGSKSICHPSFIQIFPETDDHKLRPRTMFYLAKHTNIQYNKPQGYPKDPDILAVNFIGNNFNMTIINVYNQKHQGPENNLKTIERHKDNVPITPNTIVVGDFNEHHPDWDPHYPKSTNADGLLSWTEAHGLSLVNSIGQGTFHRPHMALPSVIDLTLATSYSVRFIQDWRSEEHTSELQSR